MAGSKSQGVALGYNILHLWCDVELLADKPEKTVNGYHFFRQDLQDLFCVLSA